MAGKFHVPSVPSPILPAVRQFCTHRVDEKARVIIKEASSEAPWALHPLGNVVFVGERWLAENGLLPMDFALREGNVAGF